MPKRAEELSAVQVRRIVSANDKGSFAVGGVSGLYIQCNGQNKASWLLRKKIGSKRREMGLGAFPEIGLADARQKARLIIEQISQGIDPIQEKRNRKAELIAGQAKIVRFTEIAQEYIDKKSAEFKTQKQVRKLVAILENYVYPFIGSLVVSDIERAHVLKVLDPIWYTKNETAKRARSYIEHILSLAAVKGLRSGENPARWKGNLDLSLPIPSKVTKTSHYAALPYTQLPEFMAKLREKETRGSKALELIILTASRSGEVRNAKWSEFDLAQGVWTVPEERMKAGKPHRVPLCSDAVALVESLPKINEYLFPNSTNGRPLTDNAISKLPKSLKYEVTAHGFRSTFKDWCSERTSYADEVSELALAHVNDDRTRAAYARSELLDIRRKLMKEWQDFCRNGVPEKSADVVNIGRLKNE